jgi:hypothetical protein
MTGEMVATPSAKGHAELLAEARWRVLRQTPGPGRLFLWVARARLEKLNHADAVKAHPDALISWDFKL